MTDLTEKWKKGELPEGWYWVDYYSVDGAVMLEYIPQHNGFGYEEKTLVQRVVSQVPTYEEYQALLSDQLAKNEGVEINAELEKDLGIAESTCDYIYNEKEKAISDCKTLAQTLLKVSPEHREWLETNFKEYL